MPRWDHPRVCGEHCSAATVSGLPVGSSPRVRGTRSARGRRPTSTGDHPRVCGEHLTIPRPSFPLMGSSPRVRGTHFNRAREGRVFGIIPACAGNTLPCTSSAAGCRDHPRVCGEHPSSSFEISMPSGSSPRVRGTLLADGERIGVHGIIPACAGNTLKNPSSKYHSD